MKITRLAAAAALVTCMVASHAAHVAFMYENGPNVEVTGSGPLNTTALTVAGPVFGFSSQMRPAVGSVAYGTTVNADRFTGFTGPASYGSGTLVFASSSSGQRVALSGTSGFLFVPQGYVSGSPLSGGAIWNATTLAGLGATPGTYVWAWGAGLNADSFTLRVSLAPAPYVTATQTVAGTFIPGSTATYTVVLTNSGPAAQANNPGNEFTNVLPAGVTLVSATASSGTAVATVGTNTVTWNGSIPSSGTVTLTVTATVKPAAAGTVVSNQGSVAYDSDGDGTNDATNQTDDPAVAGAANPTSFTVAAVPVVAAAAIPTLSEWALVGLASIMALFGLARVRRL